MGAESLTKSTTNDPEFICPSPKVLGFNEKWVHCASVVPGITWGIEEKGPGLKTPSHYLTCTVILFGYSCSMMDPILKLTSDMDKKKIIKGDAS